MPDKKNHAMDTLLTHAGNHPQVDHGIVNPPVSRLDGALSDHRADGTAAEGSPHRRLLRPLRHAHDVRASWGGYECLLLPAKAEAMRAATYWSPDGPTLRLHAGLEAVEDLIADLEDGFQRLAAA